LKQFLNENAQVSSVKNTAKNIHLIGNQIAVASALPFNAVLFTNL